MLSRVGLRKTSLVDFPGRVAAVLFTPGCNFRCPYCHNAALVRPEAAADGGLEPLDEALGLVERRRNLVSGLVISGGEPLLHEEVPAIAARARALGLAVKLDTNGSHPERIGAVAADYVALDLKTLPERYEAVAPGVGGAGRKALESLESLRRGRAEYEVRITCVPGLIGPDDMDALAAILDPRDHVVLQAFRPGGCLDPAWDAKEAWPEAVMVDMVARIRKAAPRARIRGSGGLG